MILIDFLYYQFTNFYKYFEKDGTHKASGIVLTCSMLCWNLTFLIMLDCVYGNGMDAYLNSVNEKYWDR